MDVPDHGRVVRAVGVQRSALRHQGRSRKIYVDDAGARFAHRARGGKRQRGQRSVRGRQAESELAQIDGPSGATYSYAALDLLPNVVVARREVQVG